MSDNWARESAAKLKQRDNSIAQQQALLLERRKLIDEQGPALWREVRERVKKLCADLNVEYGQEVVTFFIGQADELHVQFRHSGAISELFAKCVISTAPDALEWSYGGPEAQTSSAQRYALYPNNGVVAFQNGMVPSSPESIARQMLDGLIRS